jgi:hypothetical protein
VEMKRCIGMGRGVGGGTNKDEERDITVDP